MSIHETHRQELHTCVCLLRGATHNVNQKIDDSPADPCPAGLNQAIKMEAYVPAACQNSAAGPSIGRRVPSTIIPLRGQPMQRPAATDRRRGRSPPEPEVGLRSHYPLALKAWPARWLAVQPAGFRDRSIGRTCAELTPASAACNAPYVITRRPSATQKMPCMDRKRCCSTRRRRTCLPSRPHPALLADKPNRRTHHMTRTREIRARPACSHM